MKYSKYFQDYSKSIYDLLNNFDTSLIDKSVELILDCKAGLLGISKRSSFPLWFCPDVTALMGPETNPVPSILQEIPWWNIKARYRKSA